jgi:hypothetical protein
MRPTTLKLFETIRDLVSARDGNTDGPFSTQELLDGSGLGQSDLQEELALLKKMVLLVEPEAEPGTWRLTPLGAAACVNDATFSTVFRR